MHLCCSNHHSAINNRAASKIRKSVQCLLHCLLTVSTTVKLATFSVVTTSLFVRKMFTTVLASPLALPSRRRAAIFAMTSVRRRRSKHRQRSTMQHSSCGPLITIKESKVNLDICKAPLNTITFSKALRYGNTQFYLPLLPSRRASPPFAWYSFYHPTERRRLSRPGWLVTYRNTVPPRESNPDGHPSQY